MLILACSYRYFCFIQKKHSSNFYYCNILIKSHICCNNYSELLRIANSIVIKIKGKFILIDRITKKISIYEDYIMHSLYEINYTSYYFDAKYMHINTYDFFPHSRPMSVRQSHVCSSMVSQCPLIRYIQC